MFSFAYLHVSVSLGVIHWCQTGQMFRATLTSLEQERKMLQQLLMVKNPETAAVQQDREVLRLSIAELCASVAGLKSTANSNSDLYQRQQTSLSQYTVACQV